MGSKITSMRLANCMDAIIDYRGKTPVKANAGIPLITAKIIKNGRILDATEFIAEDEYDSWMRRGIPQAGDVVLTTEAPLGEVAQLDARKVALAQRVITLRGKKGVLDNDYLLYLLQTHAVQHQLDGRGTGSTVKGIKQSELKEIILTFPRLELQKQAAQCLKNIDNKISLNNQIKKTVEKMAQELFQSWFVNFDPVIDNALDAGFFEQNLEFPEELLRRAEARKVVRKNSGVKLLTEDILKLFPTAFEECAEPLFGLGGWIPRGWGISELNELIDIKHGFAFRGEYFSDKETDEVLLTPGNVRVGGGFKFEKYKFYSGPIEENYIFSSGDIFVTMTDLSKAGDTLGYPAIVPEIIEKRFYHNQRLGKVIYRERPVSYPMFIYHTLCSASYRQSVLGSATGTTVKHTSPKKILCHRLVNSLNGLVEAEFERLVASYNLMASVNNKASLTLTRLRQILLPKLISGEITLSDSEVDIAVEG